MSQIVWERGQALANISNIAGSVPISAANIRLFKNDFHPLQTSILGDFTEADFTGYNDVPLNMTTFFFDPVTGLAMGSVAEIFQPTGVTITNQVFGWYITDDPATVWYAAERFDAPVNMASAADVCEFFARLFAAVVQP